jgi:hypothetical protein
MWSKKTASVFPPNAKQVTYDETNIDQAEQYHNLGTQHKKPTIGLGDTYAQTKN